MAVSLKVAKIFTNLNVARSTLVFTQQPVADETVVIGSVTYTFKASVAATANEVLIGDNTDDTLNNLLYAIAATDTQSGTKFGSSTVINPDAYANSFWGDGILVNAKVSGTAGNGIATTTTVTGASFNFATTVGGLDDNMPQPLSFPRNGMRDYDGNYINGIPIKLKNIVSEYALRAMTVTLNPDVQQDESGRSIKKKTETVGPITESTEYEGAGITQIPAYPAADAMISEYLNATAGGVFR